MEAVGARGVEETLASRTGDRFRVSGCEVRPCVFTSRNLSICQSIARGRDALTPSRIYLAHLHFICIYICSWPHGSGFAGCVTTPWT